MRDDRRSFFMKDTLSSFFELLRRVIMMRLLMKVPLSAIWSKISFREGCCGIIYSFLGSFRENSSENARLKEKDKSQEFFLNIIVIVIHSNYERIVIISDGGHLAQTKSRSSSSSSSGIGGTTGGERGESARFFSI